MALDFLLPDLGDGVDSADVLSVQVAPGDAVAVDQTLLELETDKAGLDLPSTFAGTIAELRVKAGDTVRPGQVILTYEPAAAAATPPPAEPKPEPTPEPKPEPVAAPAEPKPVPVAPPPADEAGPVPVFAAPSVRRFAREIGVDIYEVTGTGPGGRISIDDVKEHARTVRVAGPIVGGAPGAEFTREPMSRVRRATALQMSLCWDTVPHVSLFAKIDITDLEAMRGRYKARVEKQGGRLTLTAILVRLVAATLRHFPTLNASIEGETILYRHQRHIGVAMDTDRGLVVPVVRDADTKSIQAISAELAELGDKARRGKLSPEDMRGGTFTITNLGGFGIGFFTPIVNHPEVAILGLGRAAHEPVYDGAAFVPRLMLPLALSIDHRLVDGADGARFLDYLRELVQEPLLLALEG